MCFGYIHPLTDTTSDESFNYCVGKSIEIHIACLCINEQQKNFEHCWRTGMGFPILSFSIHSWVSLLVFSVHNKEMQCTPSFWSTGWLCENADSFLPWRFGWWHSSCAFYKIAAPPQKWAHYLCRSSQCLGFQFPDWHHSITFEITKTRAVGCFTRQWHLAAVLRTRVQPLILQSDRREATPENSSQPLLIWACMYAWAHTHTQNKTHTNTLNKVVLEIKIL